MTPPPTPTLTEANGAASPIPLRFAMRFTSTPRSARLARRLVAKRLEQWGHPPDADAHQSMTLIAGELAANAVRHGHVPGRDFRLSLTATSATLRIEVTGTRGELRPKPRSNQHDAENGRGLLIVSRLADRWAVVAHPPGHPGKTVRAEVDCGTAPLAAPRDV